MGLNTQPPDKSFCEKRIAEQNQYLRELEDRKNTMSAERFILLSESAQERKEYFEQILKEYN